MNEDYHGTAKGYRAKGCRCQPCTSAHSEAARQFRRRRGIGLVDSLVDATDVQAELQRALNRGWSMYDLSRVLDHDRRSMQRLRAHESPKLRRSTHDRLIACLEGLGAPDRFALLEMGARSRQGGPAKVPAQPMYTMLKSLMAAGHHTTTVLEVMRRHGFPGAALPNNNPALSSRSIYMTTAQYIENTHRELGHRLGPSWRTAARLYSHGWFPPACYDDDDPDHRLIISAVPEPEEFLLSWAGEDAPMYKATIQAGYAPLNEPGSAQFMRVVGNLDRDEAVTIARRRPTVLKRGAKEARRARKEARALWTEERLAYERARVQAWRETG